MWWPLGGTRQKGEHREETDGRDKEEEERDTRQIEERGDPTTY
jgi:hypothetical protein